MKELLEHWERYKTTERYKKALGGTIASTMGMGLFAPDVDIFTDFMDWVKETMK